MPLETPAVETPVDLTDVIREAMDDADDTAVAETPIEAPSSTDGTAPVVSDDAASPAASTAAAETAQEQVDEITKLLDGEGVARPVQGKRENSIPYSRVKKIVGNAEKHWTEKTLKPYIEKIAAHETKLKEVATVEDVMTKDPMKFLQGLASIPAYRDIFEKLTGSQPAAANAPGATDMPKPDVRLSDGSETYSTKGLQALLAWQQTQVEKTVAQRYAPIEQAYRSHQQVQTLLPKAQAQIAEARTWPLFTENADDILKTMTANPGMSLERGYQVVVLPKLQANRDTMRTQLLKEINAQPRATSLPASATRPNAATGAAGSGDLEAIIRESLKGAKR
jgi:hypothetical protein